MVVVVDPDEGIVRESRDVVGVGDGEAGPADQGAPPVLHGLQTRAGIDTIKHLAVLSVGLNGRTGQLFPKVNLKCFMIFCLFWGGLRKFGIFMGILGRISSKPWL